MFVWGDDCPDIDLKRFILILVYAMNWKGGNLFPSQQEIGAMPDNGIYTTLIEESDLYSQLKLWYRNVITRLDKLLCHCCRKTAYLWDYIRGEHDINKLRLQAGHDNPNTADRYFNDTAALGECMAVHDDEQQRLGKYHAILSSGSENSSRVNYPGRRWQVPLPELARGFIEDVVGIEPTHPQARQIRYLYEQVTAWREPEDNPRQAINVSMRMCTYACMQVHVYAYV
jgi:hypothetical protein